MRIRPLGRDDVRAATALLRETWPYDRFRLWLVQEKLLDDPPGEEAYAPGVVGRDGLMAFAAAVARGDTAWVKLAAVGRAHRGLGHLQRVMADCETWARARGARTLRIMDHAGNYWTPGLDVRYAEALEALGRIGYLFAGENRNLACPTRPKPAPPPPPAGVEIRRAVPSERDAAVAFASRFHPAWGWEVRRALGCRPAGVHVAVARGRIVAFAAHDGNNRGTGAFGPAGTLRAWRGKGLGELLLRACLRDAARQGKRVVSVPWVSETTLYARLGAQPAGRYRVLAKTL